MLRRTWLVLAVIAALSAVVAVFLLARPRATPPSASVAPSVSGDPPAPPEPAPPTGAPPPAPPLAAPGASAPDAAPWLDRAKRDEVRRAIYKAFGEPTPDGTEPHRVRAPAEERAIDLEYVKRHVQDDFLPMARECVKARVDQDHPLDGALVMHLHVVGDENVGGIVESTAIEDGGTIADRGVLDCLQNSMASLTMPAPASGGSFDLDVPMRFLEHPPDAEAR